MIIRDRNVTVIVHLLATDVQIARNRSADDVEALLRWWTDRARDYGAPPPRFAGADRALAASLLKQHGLDRVRRVGVVFWRRYADPLITGAYAKHFVLFKAKFSEAAQDEAATEHTRIT